MKKMLLADPKMGADVALSWSISAANSLENHGGFSPAQIVFGQQPVVPTLSTVGPPGMEEVELSDKVAEHLHALHLAREMYIKCESDRVLADALKQRFFVGAGEVVKGDWIYYKQGP